MKGIVTLQILRTSSLINWTFCLLKIQKYRKKPKNVPNFGNSWEKLIKASKAWNRKTIFKQPYKKVKNSAEWRQSKGFHFSFFTYEKKKKSRMSPFLLNQKPWQWKNQTKLISQSFNSMEPSWIRSPDN